MFYHNLVFSEYGTYLTSQVNGVNIAMDEDVLSKILGAPNPNERKGVCVVLGNLWNT